MENLVTTFRKLHHEPNLLILPNVWDAGSARVFEDAGAKAVATTSAAEGVAADAQGNIYGAEVGPRALKRYVKN